MATKRSASSTKLTKKLPKLPAIEVKTYQIDEHGDSINVIFRDHDTRATIGAFTMSTTEAKTLIGLLTKAIA